MSLVRTFSRSFSLSRVAGGNHLAAQNDEDELPASVRRDLFTDLAYAHQHATPNERAALSRQMDRLGSRSLVCDGGAV